MDRLGGESCASWILNERLCTIVDHHHQPDTFPNSQDSLFSILQVADSMLKKLEISFVPDPNISIMDLPYTSFLKLEQDSIDGLEKILGDILVPTEQLV